MPNSPWAGRRRWWKSKGQARQPSRRKRPRWETRSLPKRLHELPDINHNPFYYATLQPGVTGRWEMMDNSSPMSFGIGIYSHDDYSAFSINGATAFSASITVDGVNIQGASWNESDIEPAPEAIQEVKTYTNDYDASIGRGQGAVAIVTKSGTNNFHGVVFGRLRNDALNANTFANDVQGDSQAGYGYKPIPKAAFKVVYYGGAVGGPIKKDKAFFFASWQGMAHNATRQDLLNVPMNNQAKGDFSSPEGCPHALTRECRRGHAHRQHAGHLRQCGWHRHSHPAFQSLYCHTVLTRWRLSTPARLSVTRA